MKQIEEKNIIIIVVTIVFILSISLYAYSTFVNPRIQIWRQSMLGQAELAHAEYNRQIAVCEASAKMEAAQFLAEAEIIRAEGVARANKIIGDSLKENEGYLRYLYINHLAENNEKTVIYVPTEGALPILECSRLMK